MTLEQVSYAFRITPIWFWPVLWWNLLAFWAWAEDARERGEAGLYVILTDRRGRILIRWTAKADPIPQFRFTHPELTQYEMDDLDLISVALERIGRSALVRTVSGSSRVVDPFARLEPG